MDTLATLLVFVGLILLALLPKLKPPSRSGPVRQGWSELRGRSARLCSRLESHE